MDHGVQDSLDAQRRARSTYTAAWEPILAAEKIEAGFWHMMAEYGRCYAVIRILEIGGERGYRVTTWAERPEDRRLFDDDLDAVSGALDALRARKVVGDLWGIEASKA